MGPNEFARALKDADEIELGVVGRVSGRRSTRPVWFVSDDDALYLLPVSGSDSQWYKNVLAHPEVTLSAGGVTWTARAEPITDPVRVHDVVERFRAKYGASEVKKYYSKFDVAVRVPLR
jgi:deazaflavin-dependent oxidoreductase (nitroreductase family)